MTLNEASPVMTANSPAEMEPASTAKPDCSVDPETRLAEFADQLSKGFAPPQIRIRAFLGWFGAARRGAKCVTVIRRALEKAGLETDPDFDNAFIDEEISFRVAGTSSRADPTYRIGRLESANRKPEVIAPDATLSKAITIMLLHDFSQLPVVTGQREVKGMISWKSIGSHLAMGKKCEYVRDCLDMAVDISVDDSLFSAIDVIVANGYVLVRGTDKAVCGLITASDLTLQFRQLAEPFLLIGEIENQVRGLIHGKFDAEELRSVQDGTDTERSIDGLEDLTFGEYVRLLENDTRWSKLSIRVDRREFINTLDRVRVIRNDVMHFDPDGLSDDDLVTLRDFTRFLRSLRRLIA